ncbi:MAG: hypothetical protein V1773_17650 [bacterium]
MKNLLILGLLVQIILGGTLNAQETKLCTKINYGVELDALPYIFGGYYGSAWLKYNNFRIRPVITKITQPKFIVEDGFKNLNTKAYALIVDYFFDDKEIIKGLWIGTGLEYWDNNITENISNSKKEYQNIYFTIGGGYVINIWKNLYINPWIAGHLKFGGKSELKFAYKNYAVSNFVPEVSVKIGWRF